MALIQRFPENPLLTIADAAPMRDDFEVLCVFNPGATLFNGEVILLVRVAERPLQERGWLSTAVVDRENGGLKIVRFPAGDPRVNADARIIAAEDQLYLTSISHLRIARSGDGRDFKLDPNPFLFPQEDYEEFGIEDPRITKMGDMFWISASAVCAGGVNTALYSTRDFRSVERHGIIFCPDNKDVAILPEKIDGDYVAFHRPDSAFCRPAIWIARSKDLLRFGRHQRVAGPRPGQWDNGRIGCGAPPIKTEKGWLEIYHGATPDDRYCLGVMVFDLETPERVLARSAAPLLEPEAPYETHGFLDNVVFSNGIVERNGKLLVYYGAGDNCIAGAETTVEEALGRLNL